MKYLTLILLTFSINVFAFGWTPPGQGGGSGDTTSEAKITSFNTDIVTNTQGQQQGQQQDQGQMQGQIATGGESNQGQAQTADNDNNISYRSDATEATASSAASISAMTCQNAASGQGRELGVSFITDSVYCNILKQAFVERDLAKIATNETERNTHMNNAKELDKMALEYIEDTTTTGKWASIFLHVGQIMLSVALGVALI